MVSPAAQPVPEGGQVLGHEIKKADALGLLLSGQIVTGVEDEDQPPISQARSGEVGGPNSR
jgi:hypothetical protein